MNLPNKRPYDDFEPDDLMKWQDMSAKIRQMDQELDRIVHLLATLADKTMTGLAEISDVKTRLDDLEEYSGDLRNAFDVHQQLAADRDIVLASTPSKNYLEGQADMLEQLGTHSPDCRCAWCDPQEGTLWG